MLVSAIMPNLFSQYLNISYDDFRKEVWLVREYIEGLDLETLMKVKCTVTCYDLQIGKITYNRYILSEPLFMPGVTQSRKTDGRGCGDRARDELPPLLKTGTYITMISTGY